MKRNLVWIMVSAIISMTLVSPVISTAADNAGSVITYLERETFSSDAEAVKDADGNDQYGLYSFFDGGANLTSEYLKVTNDGDMESYSGQNASANPTLYFSIPVSDKKVILDYRVYAQNALRYTFCDLYTRTGADDTTGTRICRAYTNNTNSKYFYDVKLVLNPADGSINGTISSVNSSTLASTTTQVTSNFTASNGYAYFMFKISPLRSNGSSTNLWFDYINVYEAAEQTDFSVLSYTVDTAASTTDITVQFNSPVTAETVAAMTLNGTAAASYTDDSNVTDESNVYTLSFASVLSAGSNTLAVPETASTLDGTSFGAEKTISTPLTSRLTNNDGNVMYGDMSELFPNTSGVSGATLSYNGASMTVTQDTVGTVGSTRIESLSQGIKSGIVVVEFDVIPSRSVNKFSAKWCNYWTASNAVTVISENDIATGGTTAKYQLVMDFTGEAATSVCYKNGEKLYEATNLPNAANSKLILRFTNLNSDSLDSVTVKNFSMYTPLTDEFAGGLTDSGDAEFSHPVNANHTTATANGEAIELVKLPEASESAINRYQIDTSDLTPGTYNVVINPVSVMTDANGDALVCDAVEYTLTVDEDRLTLADDFALASDDTGVTASVTAKNHRTGKINFEMIIGEYEIKDGVSVMTNVVCKEKSIEGLSEENLSVSMTPASSGKTYKAFIWDSFGNMIPLKDDVSHTPAE